MAPAGSPTPRTREPQPRRPSRLAITLTGLVFRPWATWAARAAIAGRNRSRTDPAAGRFTRADARRLVRSAWASFRRQAPGLPAEPTTGSRQNVLLACLTLAMFNTLLDDGVERGYAIELVADACWKIYAQWGRIPRIASRLITRDPVRRIRISVNMFLTYPFNQPGYQYHDRPEPAGRALDMLRCPVADYLTAHQASDLAAGSWCNLDYQLARIWGGTLQRHGTLAAGAPRCDFRFRASANGRGDRHRNPALAENLIRAVQAACRYSLRIPPRR